MLSPGKLLYLKLALARQSRLQPEAAACPGPKTALLPFPPAKMRSGFPTLSFSQALAAILPLS